MFKHYENPSSSYFGRYPRSLQEAFKGVDYGCAIEAPTKAKKLLKCSLNAFPKVIWVSAVIIVVSILVNAV